MGSGVNGATVEPILVRIHVTPLMVLEESQGITFLKPPSFTIENGTNAINSAMFLVMASVVHC